MTHLMILVATAFAPNVEFSLPVVGYYQPADAIEIRPILGIPGASRVLDPIPLPDGVSKLHLAPGQPFALAGVDGALKILLFSNAPATGASLPSADIVEFSSDGSSAALYSRVFQRVTVITGLPNQPITAWSAEIAEPVAMALSAGAQSLAVAGEDGIVRIFTADASSLVAYQGSKISSLAFRGSTGSLVISDSGARRIVAVEDGVGRVLDNGNQIVEPGALAASRDGSTAWIADLSDNAIVRLDLATGVASRRPMDFAVKQFRRLALGDAFLLASPGQETPGWILAGAEPRGQTYFIPGIPAPEPQQ
jgi:hypothetical protein